MAEAITQANRLLAVSTPAGDDTLLLNSFSGQEGISRPFRFVLDLVADVQNNKPAQVVPHSLVGKPMTIRIELEDGEKFINGLCERFSTGSTDDEFTHYSATIVPWFSFLSLASNCRIFQAKSVPDVIEAVVSAHGFSEYFQNSLTKTYTTWDYCVQYRETDFSFLSRLMEAEGIYYYFQHVDGKHTMVLGDAPSCYTALPNQPDFNYSPATGIQDLEDTIRLWSSEEQIHPGKWTMRDFHHEMPTNNFEISETSATVCDEGKGFEVYDYPGEFAKKFNDPQSRLGDIRSEGEKLTTYRMEEEETTRVEISGVSNCRAFSSGYKINVSGGAAAGTYLITELVHRGVQQPSYRTGEDLTVPYDNKFKLIDASTTFKQLEQTPKPVIHGLQTALVVDESSSGNSEEIWPDKYGRVRVRFNWDRDAKYACWLRVVQPWAGKQWGQLWLPRTGDEVAVSFLEGDPDCPIVVGSIYNSDNLPIFTLPDNKTQSGILTHSSKGGGASNFNMLRFEDKDGSEEIYVQAEKDWNSLIKHDETRTIKNNRTSTIHVNESRTVETGDDTIDVQQGKRTITVMGNVTETVKQGNISTTANQGNIATEASMGNISVTADMGNISNTASLGNISVEASVGKITISGLTGVTLTCGASSIEMTPASISISAPMVMINS